MIKPTPVLTDSIDGRSFEVFLTEVGEFYALFDGDRIQAPSKKALHEKLRKLVRTRGRVVVPVTQIETDAGRIIVRQLTLTGLHGRTNTPLYTDDKTGATGQLYYNNVYARLSGEQIAEAVVIYRALRTAERAWEIWQEQHSADARTLLKNAQDRALKEKEVAPSDV